MAAPLDAQAIGQRIAEARGRAKLTQAILAAAVGIDRSSLAKIETGSRRVSALELARIADAVGERVEWFVEETPAAIVSRRNLQEPGAPSPRLDRMVERIARSAEFLMSHDLEFSLLPCDPMERPSTANAAEGTAAAARRLMGLSDEEPVSDVSARLAALGLLVFSLDVGDEVADAGSILLRQGGVALVNGDLRAGRRRLAVLHELGHFLFADEFTIDWRIGEQDDSDAWESRLDRFARAVLLPPSGLHRAWTELRDTDDDLRTVAVKLASRFRVDMSTLSRRLFELSLVNQSEANVVRQVRTTKADIVDHNLLVAHELEPPDLPRPYVQSVLRLYRSETISSVRATDLLMDTWDEADLPPLAPLPEQAIWKFVS